MFRFGRHYSSILLVLMSLEKYFAVYFAIKFKTVCILKMDKWMTGIIGVILTGYDSVYFVAFDTILNPSGSKVCILNVEYRVVLLSIDSIFYSFGPLALMLLTNVVIVFKFMTAKCKSNSTESTNQALAKAATRGTAMAMTVSIMFLVLTASTALYVALMFVIQESDKAIYVVLMNATQYLNHSINGVLYIIVGSRFRTELLKLCCQKEQPDATYFPHSLNNTGPGLVTISGNRM